MGTYTTFLRRPEVRGRIRSTLNLCDDDVAILFAGSIRPYKNIDAVLHALTRAYKRPLKLVVTGGEAKYDDLVPGDPLGRTRRIAEQLCILDRAILLPGFQTFDRLGELCEACDVMVLPYLEGYGSAQLLLGMTFGMHILTTATGGADEYLRLYPRSILLPGPRAEDIAAALERLIVQGSFPDPLRAGFTPPSELLWVNIARELIRDVLA